MPRRGHVPLRTCLGCGARAAQSDLIRLTIDAEGFLRIDRAGSGRGGYLHRAERGWQGFIRRKHHQRAFRSVLRKDAKEKLAQELRLRDWE